MFVLYSCSVGGEPAEFRTGFGTLERCANHGDAVFAAGEPELPESPQAGDDFATVHPEQRFLLLALRLLLFEPTEFHTSFGTFDCRAAHDDASSAAHQTVPGIPEALGNDAAIPRTQNFLFFGLATAFVSLPALRFPGLPGLRSFGWLFLALRALCFPGLPRLRSFGRLFLTLRALFFPGLLALRFFGVATLFISLATLFLGLPALRFFGVATLFISLATLFLGLP